LTLFQIRIFLEVVKCQSFSKAADNLYISQSALSKQIKSLEEETGVKLLIRKSKSIELTLAGKELLNYGKEIYQKYTEFKKRISNYILDKTQNLSVGVFSTSVDYELVTIIKNFNNENKNINITYHEIENYHMESDDPSVPYDIVITWAELIPRKWLTIYTTEDDLLLITRYDHPLAVRSRKNEAIKLSEIKNEPFISWSQKLYNQINMGLCKKAGFIPNVVHSVATANTLMHLVAYEYGIGLLVRKSYELYSKLYSFPELYAIKLSEELKVKIAIAIANSDNPASKKLAQYFLITRFMDYDFKEKWSRI